MRKAKMRDFLFAKLSRGPMSQNGAWISSAEILQVSVHAADVKRVLKAYPIEVSASSDVDLKKVSCPLCVASSSKQLSIAGNMTDSSRTILYSAYVEREVRITIDQSSTRSVEVTTR